MIQAMLMGAFTILMRAIGVSFGIYVVSRVGAATSGLSSLTAGVFGFAVTLALSGIQLGCTRLVAEGIGTGDSIRVRRTLLCTVAYALFFGTLSAVLLFSFADPIARYGLHHAEVAVPLRTMAAMLPALALSSCLCGYFVAVRRVYKSTFIQVGEQLLRILLTVFLFRGITDPAPAHALLLLARADALSCITAALCMLSVFLLDRRRHADEIPQSCAVSQPLPIVARHLLAVTLPVAVSAYARSGLISLEHLLIPRGLAAFGQDEVASLASLGALQSMALPVLLFPGALPAAFANLLVPEVTESHVRGEMSRIRGIIQRVLSLALLFAIGTAGIMIAYADTLGGILYDNPEAAHFIRLLAPLIPVMYLDSSVDAMLKGMGQQVSSMGINIIDASLSVVLVFLLTPRLGIYGYVITIYITELVNAALSIARLLRVSRVRVFPLRWLGIPALGILSATLLCRLAFNALHDSKSIPLLVLQILVTLVIYLSFSYALGAVRRRELRWILHLFAGDGANEKKIPPLDIDTPSKTVYNVGKKAITGSGTYEHQHMA